MTDLLTQIWDLEAAIDRVRRPHTRQVVSGVRRGDPVPDDSGAERGADVITASLRIFGVKVAEVRVEGRDDIELEFAALDAELEDEESAE